MSSYFDSPVKGKQAFKLVSDLIESGLKKLTRRNVASGIESLRGFFFFFFLQLSE